MNELKTMFILILIFMLLTQCMENNKMIDIQGHRGCRGLLPENSIPAFKKAIDLGVNTLELDVCISKDKKVVVSHEPWFNYEFSTSPTGEPITKENQRSFNLYEMNYDEIRKYDVGQKKNPRFAQQQTSPTYKPTLESTVDEVSAYLRMQNKDSVRYNIEIKRSPKADNVFHPPGEEFVDLVVGVVNRKGIAGLSTLQSFDVEVLQLLAARKTGYKIALLTESSENYKEKFESLGFVPDILSPFFGMVDRDLIRFARRNRMKVVPWTVNEKEDMERILLLGVDGIISDYPDRVLEAIK